MQISAKYVKNKIFSLTAKTLSWTPDLFVSPIDCKIYQLHHCREIRSSSHECPGYDTKPYNDEAPGYVKYPFIAITLTWSGPLKLYSHLLCLKLWMQTMNSDSFKNVTYKSYV